MKKLLMLVMIVIDSPIWASQWAGFEDFERDATNAIANISILISDAYTNRLHLCRDELSPSNEVSSAALLMLAICDDAKSNRIEEFVGNTNCQLRAAWFLQCPNHERIQWQKICAITMLSTANNDRDAAAEYFNVSMNALQYWDSHGNCFPGGELYKSVAKYFGTSELNPRMCLIFATAVAAKNAGMMQQFTYYSSLLPLETREFLMKESW